MYRLGPCIPISGFFLLLKVQRGCVYVIILFLVLVLFKIYVFIWKKGIGKLLHQIAQKHTAGGGRGGGGGVGRIIELTFLVSDYISISCHARVSEWIHSL